MSCYTAANMVTGSDGEKDTPSSDWAHAVMASEFANFIDRRRRLISLKREVVWQE